jgi:intein/homing endonuclease
LEKLKSVAIANGEIVYIDSRVVFPFGPIERYRRVRLLYGEQIKTEPDGDVYIFGKNASAIEADLLAARPPFEKIYEDEFLQIVRHHRGEP